MHKRKIHITSYDHARLTALLNSPTLQAGLDKGHLARLKSELERAVVVEPDKMPRDIITMNSKVRVLDMQTNEENEYTLVFPHAADIRKNNISILAPIGTALLGYKAGDIIRWEVPAGTRVLKVLSVLYQPEAAGDYHL